MSKSTDHRKPTATPAAAVAASVAILGSLAFGAACVTTGAQTRLVDGRRPSPPTLASQDNPRFRGRLQEQTRFEEINAKDAPPPTGDAPVFTQDWVSTSSLVWRRQLSHLVGQDDVPGLEVGSFEGRSAIWFLQHILTAPTARLTSVDLFGERLDAYFDHNLQVTGLTQKVEKRQGKSQKVLRGLPMETYDFVYVDGCHSRRPRSGCSSSRWREPPRTLSAWCAPGVRWTTSWKRPTTGGGTRDATCRPGSTTTA